MKMMYRAKFGLVDLKFFTKHCGLDHIKHCLELNERQNLPFDYMRIHIFININKDIGIICIWHRCHWTTMNILTVFPNIIWGWNMRDMTCCNVVKINTQTRKLLSWVVSWWNKIQTLSTYIMLSGLVTQQVCPVTNLLLCSQWPYGTDMS